MNVDASKSKKKMAPRLLLLAACILVFPGCSTTPPYVYQYVPGRTATLQNGCAVAPPEAPESVRAAIAAGNRIAGSPYRMGGGHARTFDGAYDCSGVASFVLQAAGKLGSPMPSTGFRRYGRSGYGRWITVYARKGHVFLVVAGLRFDTGWSSGPRGPKWTTKTRPARGYVVRHPPGL
jgi:hypothetical protein